MTEEPTPAAPYQPASAQAPAAPIPTAQIPTAPIPSAEPATLVSPAVLAEPAQTPPSIPAQYQPPATATATDSQAPYAAPVPPQGPYSPPTTTAPQAHQVQSPGYGPSQAEMDQYTAALLLPPPRDPEAEARRRQRQRNTIRWVGALVLAGALAAAAGLTVMQAKRTDLPGLATAPDGRYVFPALTLPTLDPGQPIPGATKDNPGGQHLADIRKLLLPAPQGAVPDDSLPGQTGWVPESTMVAMDNSAVASKLSQYGLRHTAGVAWKTPDGATTSIYLLQFIDDQAAVIAGPVFDSSLNATSGLPVNAQSSFTMTGPTAPVDYYTATSGGKTTRYGYFTEGDTSVLIIFTAPSSVSLTPFEQELQLQSQLLQ